MSNPSKPGAAAPPPAPVTGDPPPAPLTANPPLAPVTANSTTETTTPVPVTQVPEPATQVQVQTAADRLTTLAEFQASTAYKQIPNHTFEFADHGLFRVIQKMNGTQLMELFGKTEIGIVSLAYFCNELEYEGRDPYRMRMALDSYTGTDASRLSAVRCLAILVGCRGTNFEKMRTKTKNKGLVGAIITAGQKVLGEVRQLDNFQSLKDIAVCYPEWQGLGTKISRNTTAWIASTAFLVLQSSRASEWESANLSIITGYSLDQPKKDLMTRKFNAVKGILRETAPKWQTIFKTEPFLAMASRLAMNS